MFRMVKSASLLVAVGAAVVGGAGVAAADAGAQGAAIGSPGVASGNLVQVPVHIPVNACGNTVNVVGLLNPSFGNTCVNADGNWGGHHKGGWEHQDGRGHEGHEGHEGHWGGHGTHGGMHGGMHGGQGGRW